MVPLMTTRRITTMLATLALAGLLAACGSDGDSGAADDDVASVSGDGADEQAQGDDQADAEAELLDWVECMRDEGITAFPDPNHESGGIEIDGDAVGIDTPQFQAADETCKHLMGDGGSTEMHGS